MGASFEWRGFKAASVVQAIKDAEQWQRQQLHDRGHNPYSGHLGTRGVGVEVVMERGRVKQFASESEAMAFIEETHDKWNLPYLAKIGEGEQWLLAGWCPC